MQRLRWIAVFGFALALLLPQAGLADDEGARGVAQIQLAQLSLQERLKYSRDRRLRDANKRRRALARHRAAEREARRRAAARTAERRANEAALRARRAGRRALDRAIQLGARTRERLRDRRAYRRRLRRDARRARLRRGLLTLKLPACKASPRACCARFFSTSYRTVG